MSVANEIWGDDLAFALDRWHGLKYLLNDLVGIASGTNKTKNKTWYEDLCDKPGNTLMVISCILIVFNLI